MILLIFLLEIFAWNASDGIIPKDEVVYYRCFDYVRFKPMDRIEGKPILPYLKVTSDSAGLKKIEIFVQSAKRPKKVFSRINFKGGTAYVSTSKTLQCTTIDTLISKDDKLFEFRNCYYGNSGQINSQEFFHYKIVGVDSVIVKYMNRDNLIADPTSVFPADTTLNVFKYERKRNPEFKEDFLVSVQNNVMKVACQTKNSAWCQSGSEEREAYRFNGCLYWSMLKHRMWIVADK